MKPHEFQHAAKQFRAGKLSLADFTRQIFPKPTAAGTDNSAKSSADQVADLASIQSVIRQLTQRQNDSHKGDYGRLLMFAGSVGMAGAAGLTGLAALRSGAGLVSIATDSRCQASVASFHPALMTIGLPMADEDEQALVQSYTKLESYDRRYDCVAIGPGVGKSLAARGLMRALVTNAKVPTVIDADGINALADDFDFDENQGAPLILTPHPGELSRLMPTPTLDRKQQEDFAVHLATTQRIILLKGNQTMITDGQRKIYNPTGNPGMATAGSGDVLTGIIAALIGQGLSIWDSAVCGCYLHGKAGDLMADKKSQVAVVATDLIDALPDVFQEISASPTNH